MENLNDIGVIGISVMGSGIAQNLARRGLHTSVYNRDFRKITTFFENIKDDRTESGERSADRLHAFEDLRGFVLSLKRPRTIALLVKAGAATDTVLDSLAPLLDAGDIVMDMGNSFYRDTERRATTLSKAGIRFLGVGVSGGEKGALEGPSIMVGGDAEAWETVRPVLTKIAAKRRGGEPCCAYFGTGGAGHFVKMLHNGIEYGYMGVIAELYRVMRDGYGMSVEEARAVFQEFSRDREVASYLVEITAKILSVKTESDAAGDAREAYVIDVIDDAAGNKGTGMWTCKEALDRGAAVSTPAQALFARYFSEGKRFAGERPERPAASCETTWPTIVKRLKHALRLSQYVCFDQGLRMIASASEQYGWGVDLPSVLSVWENGCIIRTAYAPFMKAAFEGDRQRLSMFEDSEVRALAEESAPYAREVTSDAILAAIPVFCLSSAVTWYDGLFAKQLPTAMIQAQRDYFGAHTYRRTDREGIFHTEWE